MKSLETNEAIRIEKGWGLGLLSGSGRIGELFAYHQPTEKSDHQLKVETVKILYIGKHLKLSLHFHLNKEEIFCVAAGIIALEYILPDATKKELLLHPGDRIFIPKGIPHKMTGIEDLNLLVEVSTLDSPEDSHRIQKGD